MSWKYIHYIVMHAQVSSVSGDELSILLPENICMITWKEFMTWRLNDSTMSHSYVSNAGHRGQPKQDSNQNAKHLLNSKKSHNRELSQYTIFKDENILKPSKMNLLVTTTTHRYIGVKESWIHTTFLEMMQISKNCFNRNNNLCTAFLTRYFKVIW